MRTPRRVAGAVNAALVERDSDRERARSVIVSGIASVAVFLSSCDTVTGVALFKAALETEVPYLTSDARKALAPEREKATKITRQFIVEGLPQ
jgi:hypothetical protein